MKRSYNRTWTITNEELRKATVTIEVYNTEKYEENAEMVRTVKYTGVNAWSIIEGGREAKEIEEELSERDCDKHHEYLELEFVDGSTATYRNSRVVMWIDKYSK